MIGLREWLATAPPGTMVRVEEILARLDMSRSQDPPESDDHAIVEQTPAERIWSCPNQTRITVAELAEVFRRPTSSVYGLTRGGVIPHLKLDGHIVFIAKEVREWLVAREERIAQPKSVPIISRPRRTA